MASSILKRWVPYIPLPKHNVIAIKQPYVTYLLLSCLIFFFFVQVAFSDGNAFSDQTPSSLWAFGGEDKGSVLSGQWYRLITASLLHGSLLHLFLNAYALLAIGAFLEKLLGHAWFFVVYFFSTLGGGVLSILINDANIVSVGASGAIMGVIAASSILVMSDRLTLDIDKNQMTIELMQWLIPALIPLSSRGNIDFAGHIGGAIVGALVALFLVKTWDKRLHLPSFIKFSKLMSVIGIIIIFGSIWQSEQNRTLLTSLINDELLKEIASTKEISKENIKKLQKEYPDDPRTWLFSAIQQSDLDIMERYMRRALSKKEALHSFYLKDLELEKELQIFLAHVLLDQGKGDEAQEIIIPHCNSILNNSKDKEYSFHIYNLCKKAENSSS